MTAIARSAEIAVTVLVIGPIRSSEFALLREELDKGAPGVRCEFRQGLHELDCGRAHPDVVIVLQRHPDEYSSLQIRQLLTDFPLSRLLVCCGPWCDSLGRTRDDWPPANCVRASMVADRLHQELETVRGHLPPVPLTANRDERWFADLATVTPGRESRRSVAVHTPDPGWLQYVIDVFAAAGFDCISQKSEHADILLWDVDPWSASQLDRIATSRRRNPTQAIVAMAGYHRPSEAQRLLQAGAIAVVSKLSPLHVQIEIVEQVAATSESQARAAASTLRIVSSA